MKSDTLQEPRSGFEKKAVTKKRTIAQAQSNDPELGPLALLPGTWANIRRDDRDENGDGSFNDFISHTSRSGQSSSPMDGRGWNLIALPFIRTTGGPPYRLLMNQYNEVLHFDHVSDNVPNRGIDRAANVNTDQNVAALDYTQRIQQLAAEDDVNSDLALGRGLDIHHEPGFFLHMKDQTVDGFTIARLATIPHGNSATAVGKFAHFDGPPTIPSLSGMPEGASTFDVLDEMKSGGVNGYLSPYFHFSKNGPNGPFKGVVQSQSFPGFFPEDTNFLLNLGLGSIKDKVKKTTELVLDTDVMEAGIVNIPFIERQADAAVMRSTFWIMELNEKGPLGEPRLVLAYSQLVLLDFFPRQPQDGRDGFIRWPHVSINMMEKIANPTTKTV